MIVPSPDRKPPAHDVEKDDPDPEVTVKYLDGLAFQLIDAPVGGSLSENVAQDEQTRYEPAIGPPIAAITASYALSRPYPIWLFQVPFVLPGVVE